MLDTHFPRPVGDIGHPDSFAYPVIYRRVRGASAHQAVRGDVDALLSPFIAAGRELIASGSGVIGTSCGFLSLFQSDLEAALDVPVVASALSLVAKSAEDVGIITIDRNSLTQRHLSAAGIENPVPVAGLPKHGELATVIFEDRTELDLLKAEAEVLAAAIRLVNETPSVKQLVFECTNLGPYKAAVEAAVGRKVVTIIDALEREMKR